MHLRSALLACCALISACGESAPVGLTDPRSGDWRPVWGDLPDAPIRPDVLLGPSGCTSGFLFVDPERETYYLSTAGHCTAAYGGLGSRISVEGFGEVGTVVFESNPDTVNEQGLAAQPRLDFSLIELDPGLNLRANPQNFGLEAAPEIVGPTGILYCADLSAGEAFIWHGYGTGYETTAQTRRREGSFRTCTQDQSSFMGPAPASGGDSGSAVLHRDTGAAIGLLTGYNGEGVGESFGYIFDGLAAGGYGAVALATVDGGYVGAPR